MTSDFAAQKSRPTLVPSSQTIAVEPSVDILASLVRPSNAVHSRTHSHSHCSAESSTAFPLSLSLFLSELFLRQFPLDDTFSARRPREGENIK